MPADVPEQLRALVGSFDEFVGDIGIDEMLDRSQSDADRFASDSSPSRMWPRVALAAAAVIVLVGGLFAFTALRRADDPSPVVDGSEHDDAALAAAIVDRDWVAIDIGSRTLPQLRFSTGDDPTRLEVNGFFGNCNSQSGSFQLDDGWIIDAEIRTTLALCDGPGAGISDSGTLALIDGELIVSGPSGVRIPYVAIDTLAPVAPQDLVGTYTVGATRLTITADTIVSDTGCSRTWVLEQGSVLLDGPACASPSPLSGADRWDSPVIDGERVIVQTGDRYVRLDRSEPTAQTAPPPTTEPAPASSTTLAPAVIDPDLSTSIELSANEVAAGEPLEGFLVISNLTGAPIEVRDNGCEPAWSIALLGGPLDSGAAFPAVCNAEPFVVPAGITRFPVTLTSTFNACSPNEPPTNDLPACGEPPNLMPPAPSGEYQATFVGNLPGIPVPAPIPVTVR